MTALVLFIAYSLWHDYRVRQKRKDCRAGKHRWSRWREIETLHYGDKYIWQCHCHECGIVKQEVNYMTPKKVENEKI